MCSSDLEIGEQLKNSNERHNERTYHVMLEKFFQFEVEDLNHIMVEKHGSEKSDKDFGEHGRSVLSGCNIYNSRNKKRKE